MCRNMTKLNVFLECCKYLSEHQYQMHSSFDALLRNVKIYNFLKVFLQLCACENEETQTQDQKEKVNISIALETIRLKRAQTRLQI